MGTNPTSSILLIVYIRTYTFVLQTIYFTGKNNNFSSQYTNNMKNYGVDDNCEITILIVTDSQQGSAHWKLLKFQQCKKHCMVKIFADIEHESTV